MFGTTTSISSNGDKATVVLRPGFAAGKYAFLIDTPNGPVDWTVSAKGKYDRACTIGMVDGIHPNLAGCFEKLYSNNGKLEP